MISSNIFTHRPRLLVLLSLLSLGACQPAIFKTPKDQVGELAQLEEKAMGNYRIAEYDQIAISVYTNNGEQLIDPLGFFQQAATAGQGGRGGGGGGGNPQQQLLLLQGGNRIPSNNIDPFWYNVDEYGEVNLPLLGNIKLAGLTLREADSLLSRAFHKQGYYKDAYVTTQYLNKRVLLYGALGEQIIPLRNENMTLLEVIAQANTGAGANRNNLGGNLNNLQRIANARKIMILRNLGTEGQLQQKLVNLKDLTTLTEETLYIQPNDIIYIAPRNRIDRDVISDLSTIISAVSSLLTVYLLINSLN